MARVLVTLEPQSDEERRVVDRELGGEAAWLVDGASATEAEAALSFFPQGELRRAGVGWGDLPGLRLLQVATAGANHVGWSTLPERVQVAATPGATGPFIAEYVLGAVIPWARGFWHHTQEIRRGRFHQGAMQRGLSQVTVGFVGYGGIGRACAELLARHGCRMIAVSRSGEAPAADRQRLEWLGTQRDLPRLFSESDAVVVCAPFTAETQALVDLDLLSGLAGRDALLVNVSRGHVVDEASLFAWLDSDATRHWAVLDVWWRYPRGEGFPFTEAFHRLPNVVMTPHNSPNVAGFRLAMLEAAARHLRRWLDAGEVLHAVARERHQVDVDADPR